MLVQFAKANGWFHTWLKLDLASNRVETNLSFSCLYLHQEVVSRWFHVVDDVRGLELEGRVKMITGAHG